MNNGLLNIPQSLERVEVNIKQETGEICHKGKLRNLHVNVYPNRLHISGSLSIFHLGTNLNTLTRRETAYGIEHLSDELHVDLSHARINRIDFGTNLILERPFSEYMPFLGEYPYYSANRFGSGKKRTFTFANSLRQLRFYDKIREVKKKGHKIPDEWLGLNVCRYEASFLHPAKEFKIQSVTANMLSEQVFFCKMLEKWNALYNKIPKVTKMKILPDIPLETIHDLHRFALAALAQNNESFSILMSEFSRRDLSKSQRSRLKSKIRESRIDRSLTIPDNRILELDQKVSEAARIYQS